MSRRAIKVSVSTQQAAFLDSCVESGEYLSIDEVVRAGIRLLSRGSRAERGEGPAFDELRVIFDQVPALIAFVDRDMRYRFANQTYVAFFGRTRQQVLGAHVSSILGANAFAEVAPHLERAFAGEEVRYDLLAPHRDGAARWVEARYVPRRDTKDAPVDGVFVLVADVHDRVIAEKRRAELEESLRESTKLEAVGRLAGGIAHDFNNLLTVVLGHAEQLLEKASDDVTAQALGEIRDAGDRAASLTKQLLAFSRQQVLHPEVLALGAVIEDLAPLLRRVVPDNIELRVFAREVTGHVQADASQLEQVCMNLILNARDALPDGGTITIEIQDVHLDDDYIQLRPEAKRGDHVVISVTDTGEGIPQEAIPRIFEPFYTSRSSSGGTGLGLASVHGIVKQSGGHILVYSELGQGTTFKVYLPAVDSPLTTRSPRPAAAPVDLAGTETILVCDDFEPITRSVATALEHLGYRILEATSPSEARQISRRCDGSIDLLVTDVVMPEMNGRQLFEVVREAHPNARVLYVSGYTSNVIIHQGVVDEGVQFLEKPFNVRSIREAVRRALDEPPKS